jgi:DNA polymerase-3 subunit epsilon
MGRPGGATPEELIGLVFTARGRDPEFGPRFLSSLLGADARFRFEPDRGRWRATVHDVLVRSIDDVPFVVFDLETTGERPAPDTITEIGAVRLERGRVTGTFSTLVRPGRPIQPFVVRLTGITDDMVADAPRIGEAIDRFRAFIGDAALVAHNAAFDLGHLEAAHEHLTGARLGRPVLCTIKLARRLLPELRRRSLDTVASTLGIACFDRHRALPDARIAADVFAVFLERARERGIDRLDALLDFQQSAADGLPFVVHVPRQRLDDVPAVPGVYHLLGADGRLLYVGKARRLRERLSSYFANARGHSRKTLDLIRHVYDFRIQETGSELAASLLEARQIREHKPPYNRQRRHLPRVGFVKLSVTNAYPRLWITQRLAADRTVHVGPFAGREAAERAQTVLARTFGLRTCAGSLAPSPDMAPCMLGQIGSCPAPCAARVDREAYRRRVDACLAFLDGCDEEPLARLTAERERLSTALRFEAAARVQRDLDQLEIIRRRQRTLAWVVTRQNFSVLLPGINAGAAQLYVVLGGRVAIEAHVTASADLLAVTRLVRDRYDRYQAAPLGREDVEGATILAAWLRDRGQEGILLPLDGPDALERRLDELVVTLDDLRQRGPLPAIDGLG